jgi:hypothetical protein
MESKWKRVDSLSVPHTCAHRRINARTSASNPSIAGSAHHGVCRHARVCPVVRLAREWTASAESTKCVVRCALYAMRIVVRLSSCVFALDRPSDRRQHWPIGGVSPIRDAHVRVELYQVRCTQVRKYVSILPSTLPPPAPMGVPRVRLGTFQYAAEHRHCSRAHPRGIALSRASARSAIPPWCGVVC